MKLQYDPDTALAHLCRRDRRLERLIKAVGAFNPELRSFRSPFEALTQAIVFQQLSGTSASAIHKRLLANFPGQRHPTAEQIAGLSDAELRELGLSRAKSLAMRDLAEHTLDGRLPSAARLRRMTDEDIIQCSVAVRGVGAWTAQMMLIFYLGRPDVLPATDLGIRKGFMLAFGGELPEPADIESRAAKWRPYRSVASWYLWQATRL